MVVRSQFKMFLSKLSNLLKTGEFFPLRFSLYNYHSSELELELKRNHPAQFSYNSILIGSETDHTSGSDASGPKTQCKCNSTNCRKVEF